MKTPSRAHWCAPTVALALGACIAPPPADRTPDRARDVLVERTHAGSLERVLDEVEWAPATFLVPSPEASRDVAHPAYWLLRAVAYAPEVRAARGAWRAARAARTSAGAPGPVAVQATDHEFGGEDKLLEGAFVLDLVGLFGLGPARAERARATAEEALALGALERTVWDAWLAAERARIIYVAVVRRQSAFSALASEARADLERVDILLRTGRVGAAPAEAAEAIVRSVERRASVAGDLAVRRAAELAVRVGESDVEDAALAAGLQPILPDTVDDRAWLDDADAWERHPALREARLRFAVREAAVREAAARAWPSVGFGPHIARMDDTRIGGILRFNVPFPSSWRGLLVAAVERRDAELFAYEDLYFALREREADAAARFASASARVRGLTRDLDAATDAAWTGMRASFRTARIPVLQWVDALQRRAEAVVLLIDDQEAAALAALDLIAARGAAASPFGPQEARP